MKILMLLFLMITLVLGYLGVAWMSVSATQVEVGASDLQEVKHFNPSFEGKCIKDCNNNI